LTQLQTLIEEIPKYQPGADLEVLQRAYRFSERSHQGQQRASGEPYLSHPLQVASLLVDFKMDVTTVTAGLLHDVLEDTSTTKADLEAEFGKEIAELVDGVTKIGKLAFSSREERQAENFRKMLVAMARDLRVLMIKLADRLHNMRTLDYLGPDKARKIAQETLDIYAPLAHRLGMAKVKAELEDLALRAMSPDAYVDLQKRVAKRRLEREADINHVIAIIERKLSEVGIESQIRGRPKHFYSIFKKMHDQGREFDEIYDLTAVRVITGSVRDCYGALGVIHSLWKPVPGRFKDFIAMPKVNMYQSLHTTVIGPKGEPVEIQIRTWDMHRIAEEGIAAHWLYKEKKTGKDKLDDSLLWLRQLMETQQDTKDPREFLDSVRVDLFPDEVYVFTPKGDVKALPEGATPIDFAYTVHTKVGEHTVGAKVNGKLVPLRYVLRQGDIVEIVTSPNQHPSRDWLKIAKSTRARTKINQWLKVEERARSIELGREMFEREAKKYRLNATALMGGEDIKKIASDLGHPTVDDLLAAVGYGKASLHQLLNRLVPGGLLEPTERPRPASTRPKAEQGVRIRGVEDLLVRFAKCCNPLPGDPIVGFITRGRGLTVHARDCLTVAKSVLDRERIIDV
jgi:GTP pyrophosphokinase